MKDAVTAYNSTMATPEQAQRLKMLATAADRTGRKSMQWDKDPTHEKLYREMLTLLWPHDCLGKSKIRIGPRTDGGCVILTPTPQIPVISFGSYLSSGLYQRDLALAQCGHKVAQFYDSTQASLSHHPNISFYSNETPTAGASMDVEAILSFLPDSQINGALLIADLHGREWQVLENMDERTLGRFSQMHIIFHDLDNSEDIGHKITVFRKIFKIYVPVHIHLHNNAAMLGFRNFLVTKIMEITFANRNLGNFAPSYEEFPTALDAPNLPSLPEAYLGRFSLICGDSELHRLSSEFGTGPVEKSGIDLSFVLKEIPELHILLDAALPYGAERVFFWLLKYGINEHPVFINESLALMEECYRMHATKYSEDCLQGYSMLVHALWLSRRDLHFVSPSNLLGQQVILTWFRDCAITEYGLPTNFRIPSQDNF